MRDHRAILQVGGRPRKSWSVPSARTVARGDAQSRRRHRRLLATGGDDDLGIGQPRFRVVAERRAAVRAPRLPFGLRPRRPEGRHGRLRRETHGELQEPLIPGDFEISLNFRWTAGDA